MIYIYLLFSSIYFCIFNIIDLDCIFVNNKFNLDLVNFGKNCKRISNILYLFAILYIYYIFRYNNYLLLINLSCFCCLHFSSITDIKYKYIHIYPILIALIIILILNYFGNYLKISIEGILFAVTMYLIIYLLGRIISGKEVFGIGDIYAFSIVGLSTDWFTAFNIGLFAFIIASLHCIINIIKNKNFRYYSDKEISFVPYILCAYMLFIFF